MKQFNNLLLWCLFLASAAPVLAQKNEVTPLFQDEKPLAIRLAYSFKEVKKNTVDSIYFPSKLLYKNGEKWDSLDISVRARGNFRRKNCFFAPLRIKIKKGSTKGTLFEGNKSLKLVLPCQTAKSYNDLILKEYLCYQFYESITPYTFNTRLLDITLIDNGGKQSKTYQIKGFFVEDDDLIAKRFKGKIVDLKLNPLQLHDTSSVRHDFFEFMIANTDWSTVFQHNAKVMQLPPRKYIPIAYDFDMSGFVNAPYATVNESLEISSVQERIYRGFCRDAKVVQLVRSEFIKEKPAILSTFDTNQNYFEPKELNAMKKYIMSFYEVIENDSKFKEKILDGCRTK